MNPQFTFQKPEINGYAWMNATPEKVVMLEIAKNMKNKNMRSFKSYLKWAETNRIQRANITVSEVEELLKISRNEAEYLIRKWKEEIGGTYSCCANLDTYYFPGVYEIVA